VATTPFPSAADPRTLITRPGFRSQKPFPSFEHGCFLLDRFEASASALPGKLGDGRKPRDPVGPRLTQEQT
jgi:hypothetical protein